MPTKLVDYQVVQGEKRWTYQLKITFNDREIIEVTITDHYQENHPEITNELIIKLLKRLNGRRLRPTKYKGKRKVFKRETTYNYQPYRLIFWFKDNETNHLWVRNCHPID